MFQAVNYTPKYRKAVKAKENGQKLNCTDAAIAAVRKPSADNPRALRHRKPDLSFEGASGGFRHTPTPLFKNHTPI